MFDLGMHMICRKKDEEYRACTRQIISSDPVGNFHFNAKSLCITTILRKICLTIFGMMCLASLLFADDAKCEALSLALV